MAFSESNGHVIDIQDGGKAEVCTLWVLFLVIIIIIIIIILNFTLGSINPEG